jgi:hypothetical protein
LALQKIAVLLFEVADILGGAGVKFSVLPMVLSCYVGSGRAELKGLTAKDAKCGFGGVIDLARAEPVAVPKHGRPVPP